MKYKTMTKLADNNPQGAANIADDRVLAASFNEAINGGIIIGLKESKKALEQFMERKIQMGYAPLLSINEISLFLQTYIDETRTRLNCS